MTFINIIEKYRKQFQKLIKLHKSCTITFLQAITNTFMSKLPNVVSHIEQLQLLMTSAVLFTPQPLLGRIFRH